MNMLISLNASNRLVSRYPTRYTVDLGNVEKGGMEKFNG